MMTIAVPTTAMKRVLLLIGAPAHLTPGVNELSAERHRTKALLSAERYCPDVAAQTATSGLLAAVGTIPQEAEFSVRNVAACRAAPQ